MNEQPSRCFLEPKALYAGTCSIRTRVSLGKDVLGEPGVHDICVGPRVSGLVNSRSQT